jgi:hypothetical protein
MFVLDAICDDYENIAEITKHVEHLASRCGMTFESAEIVQALGSLMDSGLARGYLLTPTSEPPEEIERLPDPGELEKYYFLVTKKGMDLQLSDYEGWPFDDENALRKDWRPPHD